MSKKTKALLLFSGGLDSILAVKILQDQKTNPIRSGKSIAKQFNQVIIKALIFKSYFFDSKEAEKRAKELNIPFKIADISKKHLKIVKNPDFGYGKRMNPCLDCRILMLKKAKEIMKKEKYDFIATGEVLGQRPMSQNKKSLKISEEKSLLKGYLLRPLSAKLLEETVPENKGHLERKKLLDIQGRSRKKQMELARKYNLKSYPNPSGGCLLTDPEFSRRLKELMKIYPDFKGNDVSLLKSGRHFWQGKNKIVVGREKKENERIKKMARKKDFTVEMKNYPGPLTLVRNYGNKKISKKSLERAKNLTKFYSRKARNRKDVAFKIG
jgi:tRNA-uridine 2-sulfurtransferase